MSDSPKQLEEFRLSFLKSLKLVIRGFLREAVMESTVYLVDTSIRVLDWHPDDTRECRIDIRFTFHNAFLYKNSIPHIERIKQAIRIQLPQNTHLGSIIFVHASSLGGVEAQQEFNEPLEMSSNPPNASITPIKATGTQQVANNQANWATSTYEWEKLKFRSKPEVEIAKALDKAGVLFFPNCMARLGTPGRRILREPDFLVCHRGKWGIIEVDGDSSHPPSQIKKDQERMRAFRRHAIQLIEHYDAKECLERPDEIVAEFLEFLEQQK